MRAKKGKGCFVTCFVAGTAVLTPDGALGIEKVAVGQRVASSFEDQPTKVDETWRHVRVSIGEEDTIDHLVIDLLRPASWLTEARYVKGARVFLEIEELDVADWGVVESIQAAPKVVPGAGRVVLATSERWNRDVFQLELERGDAPLLVTGAHPLFSLDADGWVQVRDLQVGERLQTEKGALAIAALSRERGLHRVYNFEAEGEHEYLVGDVGLRVHNTCPVERVTGDALKAVRKEFNRVKRRFWKNESATNPGRYSAEDIKRMEKGKAPIGNDGHAMELHHRVPLSRGGKNTFDNLQAMTRTEHRLGSKFKENHPDL